MPSVQDVWTDRRDHQIADPDNIRKITPRNLIEHIYNPPNEKGCDLTEARLEDLYAPLSPGTIRLVHLSERHRDSSIPSCSLEEFRGFDHGFGQAYTAVSYTWIAEEYSWYGVDLPESTTMIIQDHLVSIPSRLALILGVFFEAGVRDLWIDYLSINQLDDSERGRQVAMMDQIFASAAQTVIFLGKPTADTDVFFSQACGKIHRFSKSTVYPKAYAPGLRQIAQHRYWRRAWILQEVGKGRNTALICGKFIIDWKTTLRLTSALFDYRHNSAPESHWRFFRNVRNEGHPGYHRKPFLHQIARRTISAECSDPRDALFSKIHLAVDTSTLGEPDYTESVKSLFTRFAVSYVNQPAGLKYLRFASGCENRLGIPSWAVDWTPRQEMPDMSLRKGFEKFILPGLSSYGQSTPLPIQISVVDDHRELVVFGRVVRKLRPFNAPPTKENVAEEAAHSILGAVDVESSMFYDDTFLCASYTAAPPCSYWHGREAITLSGTLTSLMR